MPKSRCASITSRPLLTRVAELIVTNGPMSQVGCASACSGVTSCSSSRVRPRNGPPLAVSTRRRTSSARPPRRHWASALCSESTGTIWPGRARAVTSGPPMISDSLLASASVLPASSAASVGRRPTAPVMPLSTTSQSSPAAVTEASSPSPAKAGENSRHCCSKSSSWEPPAVSATTRNRSGLARTTSRAWVPIDPVEPRTTMSRGVLVTAYILPDGGYRRRIPPLYRRFTDGIEAKNRIPRCFPWRSTGLDPLGCPS